jgi:hypothetical protein
VRTRAAKQLMLALLLMALLAPPAAAATHRWQPLQLSRDGHHWKTHLRGPLFDKRVLWVPGTKQTATFFVRNNSGSRADLKIVVRVTDTNHVLRPGGVRMKAHAGMLTQWRRVRQVGPKVVALRTMPAGRVVPVQVWARMVRKAGWRTMDTNLHFMMRVRLTKHVGGHR